MACSLAATAASTSNLCHPAPQLSPWARPYHPGRVVLVQWSPPPRGWCKLNFDGSVYHDGSARASIGGAIRDNAGRVVLAFAETTEHSTVGIVEARAMIRGLRLALGLNLQRLVVEGDDLVLVQLLRGEDTQTRIPVALQEEIHGLLRRFQECDVRHVYREGNQVAHTLCRQAYHCPGVWTGIVSSAVFDKAEEDRRGVLHERAVVR
jgi:ribonuclease HI